MKRAIDESDATIEVKDARKRFGSTQALDGMAFTVKPGQVTGFVGPNGAGKSTTMRVILGLDRPDQGSALVGGRPYRDLRTPLTHIGALLDAAAVQPGRRARHPLLWLAHSQGLRAARVEEVLRQVGLRDVAGRKAGGFSLGMRQRLGIQDTADHVIVVLRCRIVADIGVRELLESVSRSQVTLRTSARDDAMTVLARSGATVSSTGPDAISVTGLPAENVVSLLAGHGAPFSEVSSHRASLEEAYMELTRDAVQYRGVRPEEAGR
ncbi:ATP-binding cassette domain-containing protein [Streptomyces sp. NPDC003233]